MLSGKNTMLSGKRYNVVEENNNNIVRKNTMPREFRGVLVVWYRQGIIIEAYNTYDNVVTLFNRGLVQRATVHQ